MAGIAEAYLVAVEGYYHSSNEFANIELAMQPISELYADHPVSSFRPLEFRTARGWWVRRKVSRQYANKQSKRVLRMLRWAVGEGLIPASIPQGIACVEPLRQGRTTAYEAPPVKPVESEIVDKTLAHLPPVVADMVRFQHLVACRPGEVCLLKPSMFDRTNSIWLIELAEHKNAWRGKKRTMYVGPKAQAVILPYLLRDSEAYCFSPKENVKKLRQDIERRTPLNQGNRPGYSKRLREGRPAKRRPGTHYTTGTYAKAISRACDKAFKSPSKLEGAELKKWQKEHRWSPNQLRHNAATAIRKEFGLEAAAVILGHSQIGVTQVYAEADRSKAISIVAKVG